MCINDDANVTNLVCQSKYSITLEFFSIGTSYKAVRFGSVFP